MTEQELKARIEPLGKRTRYELVRALYIWVSYGVKVQFSGTFSKTGMRIYEGLCGQFTPLFTEMDEEEREKLKKNTKIPFTFEQTCRKLQVDAEICNKMQKTASRCRNLQVDAVPSDKENGEKKESLPPRPSIIEKEKREKKENRRSAAATTHAGARETDGGGDFVPFSSVPDNNSRSSVEAVPGEDGGEGGSVSSATVLDVNVQAFMSYWNAQNPMLFVPCQYLNGVQTAFLKRLLATKGLQFVKTAVDICTKAVFFQDWAQRGYKLDTCFFLDDEHFTKIINHRYDKRHKRLDKHQQAIEYARREAYEDLQRSTRAALESHDGLLEELSRDLPDA